MKKLIIPTILTATILIAGMFAFMPVEQAASVHTTIQASTSQIIRVSGANTIITPAVGGDATDRTSCVKASTTPFQVLGVNLATTTDANANLDLAAMADGELSTNLVDDPAVDITVVTAATTAEDNFDYLHLNTLIGHALTGTTTVSFGPLADATAGDAADAVTVSFILKASGSDTAASFVCTLS